MEPFPLLQDHTPPESAETIPAEGNQDTNRAMIILCREYWRIKHIRMGEIQVGLGYLIFLELTIFKSVY